MNPYIVICASLLTISVIIYGYAALIIHRANTQHDISIRSYRDSVDMLKSQYTVYKEHVENLEKRLDDCLNLNDKILDHTDDIIKDNYRLSQEIALLSQEIRKGLEERAKEEIKEEVVDS